MTGGYTLRHIGPVRARGVTTEVSIIPIAQTVTTQIDTTDPPELKDRNFSGLTVGGGMELGRGRLRLLPEFRYTRWTANISGAGGLLRFAPNQAEVLVGVLF